MPRFICAALICLALNAEAQTKKIPVPADYGQWETLGNPGRFSGLSPDGKWLASVVSHLTDGRDTSFGNVSEFAWQDVPTGGHLLAIAISAEDKTGNGVQLFDTATGSLRVLDSASSVYSGLAWRKDSADLAALRWK